MKCQKTFDHEFRRICGKCYSSNNRTFNLPHSKPTGFVRDLRFNDCLENIDTLSEKERNKK